MPPSRLAQALSPYFHSILPVTHGPRTGPIVVAGSTPFQSSFRVKGLTQARRSNLGARCGIYADHCCLRQPSKPESHETSSASKPPPSVAVSTTARVTLSGFTEWPHSAGSDRAWSRLTRGAVCDFGQLGLSRRAILTRLVMRQISAGNQLKRRPFIGGLW